MGDEDMGTADVAATVVFSGLALIAGAALLYTWITVGQPASGHLLGVPMMATIAGGGTFSVVMVVTSLAGLPAWLRVLLALVAGTAIGVFSRNLWHDRNLLLISARQNAHGQPSPNSQDD
jgi:hypothetical protein